MFNMLDPSCDPEEAHWTGPFVWLIMALKCILTTRYSVIIVLSLLLALDINVDIVHHYLVHTIYAQHAKGARIMYITLLTYFSSFRDLSIGQSSPFFPSLDAYTNPTQHFQTGCTITIIQKTTCNIWSILQHIVTAVWIGFMENGSTVYVALGIFAMRAKPWTPMEIPISLSYLKLRLIWISSLNNSVTKVRALCLMKYI